MENEFPITENEFLFRESDFPFTENQPKSAISIYGKLALRNFISNGEK